MIRTAIIGAGMAGMTCAHALREAGHKVTVFEKSRGIGGRLSTRRSRTGFQADHGAPYIRQPESPEFAAALGALALAGSVAQWRAGDETLMVGVPRMNALLAPWADGLDIHLDHTVTAVSHTDHGMSLEIAEAGPLGPFDRLIVCIPAVQARALLTGPEWAALDDIRQAPVWTLMLGFSEPLGDQRVLENAAHPDIYTVICDSAKPGRETPFAQTHVLHASPEWSAANLEIDKDAAIAPLLALFRQVAGDTVPEPAFAAAHRWRYALTRKPLGHAFLTGGGNSIYCGGDWAFGDEVEDAYRSGHAIAADILGS